MRCWTKSSSRVFMPSATRASPSLHAIGGDRRALHIAGMRHGDRNLLVGDQVFEINLGGFV